MFLCILAARGEFSAGLWPTTNVYRYAHVTDMPAVSNVPMQVRREVVTETWTGGVRGAWTHDYQRVYLHGGATNGSAMETSFFARAEGSVTSIAAVTWTTYTPVVRLSAKDRIAWESWMAAAERDVHSAGPTSAVVVLHRNAFSNLVHAKTWAKGAAGSFIIPMDLDAWQDAHPGLVETQILVGATTVHANATAPATTQVATVTNALTWPPKWHWMALLASNGLPADYLDHTEYRHVTGEGAGRYGYSGMRPIMTSLVWTVGDEVWLSREANWDTDTDHSDEEVTDDPTTWPDYADALSFVTNRGAGEWQAELRCGAWSLAVANGRYLFWYVFPENVIESPGVVVSYGAAEAKVGTGVVVGGRSAAVDVYLRARLGLPEEEGALRHWVSATLANNGTISTAKYTRVDTLSTDSTGRFYGVDTYGVGLGKPGDPGDPGPPWYDNETTSTWAGCVIDASTFIIRHDVTGGLQYAR
jgi:hypothetical protein